MVLRRLAVIGTGLIGGSIALGAKEAGVGLTVTGYDHDPRVLAAALARGALDAAAASPGEAAADADLVVLSVPVDHIEAACGAVAETVPSGAVVTDVGSAKEALVAAGEAAFGSRFVGGHPMAGSERHGIEAADPRLFSDAWWILTPTEATSSEAYSLVTRFVSLLKARPVALDPAVHDALIARLSHVPQLAASALVEVAASDGDDKSLLGLAANGFRDVTRIAASNPDLWLAILRSNRGAILDALGTLRATLDRIARLMDEDRWGELHQLLARTRSARLELFAKPVYTGEPVALSLLIPDRPGVLAEVTTAAGNLGANIEDLRIVHSTEGGQGQLELVVAGRSAADALISELTRLGYAVHTGLVD